MIRQIQSQVVDMLGRTDMLRRDVLPFAFEEGEERLMKDINKITEALEDIMKLVIENQI